MDNNFNYTTELNFTKLRKQRGASLLEAVAYLGIAALIILGAISLLRGAFGGANTNRVSTEISTLETNTRRLFAVQGTFPGGNFTGLLLTSGLIPGTLTKDAAAASGSEQLINAFQGRTKIGGASATNAVGANFWIVYSNVPQDSCVALLTNATASRVIATQTSNGAAVADGQTTMPTLSGGTVFQGPVAAADAGTACKFARNDIQFYY